MLDRVKQSETISFSMTLLPNTMFLDINNCRIELVRDDITDQATSVRMLTF